MAKFSKAHYVILAEVFKKSQTVEAAKENLIKKLAADNQKFDVARFLRASGR
jgi:hypothetical protein